MLQKFKELFRYVPSDNFKLPMGDFVGLDHYQADGKTYQIFKHNESRLQIVVEVDTNKVVNIRIGRKEFY